MKEREGLDGVLARMEAQRATLDAEVAQMRHMLQDAGEAQAVERSSQDKPPWAQAAAGQVQGQVQGHTVGV